LLPSAVTIVPFTETAPEVMSFSALRREPIPAAAMIFCKRSEGMLTKGYQETGKCRQKCAVPVAILEAR